MNALKQRSSLASSFLTGLIGWIGFMFVGPLVFGWHDPVGFLFLLAVAAALVQVVFLRSLFFLLQMHRHILIGTFWGLVSAIGIYFVAEYFIPDLAEHQMAWLAIFAYIGAPVGAFLSYFYRDDKKITDTAHVNEEEANYGRDAHWLEPFAYGAIAYLIAFLPFKSLDLTVNVFLIGAITGVFAAGTSHFSPDKLKRSFITLFLLIIGLGTVFGFLSGFLFRGFAEDLPLHYFTHALIGSLLTFLTTFLRGRQLAFREEAGTL